MVCYRMLETTGFVTMLTRVVFQARLPALSAHCAALLDARRREATDGQQRPPVRFHTFHLTQNKKTGIENTIKNTLKRLQLYCLHKECPIS